VGGRVAEQKMVQWQPNQTVKVETSTERFRPYDHSSVRPLGVAVRSACGGIRRRTMSTVGEPMNDYVEITQTIPRGGVVRTESSLMTT